VAEPEARVVGVTGAGVGDIDERPVDRDADRIGSPGLDGASGTDASAPSRRICSTESWSLPPSTAIR
jgi:hypothetical protein